MTLTAGIINQKQTVKPTCGCKQREKKIKSLESIIPKIPEESVLSTLMRRIQ